MSEPRPLRFSCAWVPGTMDRVRITSPLGTHEVALRRVRDVLGRAAVQDLYLLGRYAAPATEAQLLHLLDQLGCPAAEPRPPKAPPLPHRAASEPLALD